MAPPTALPTAVPSGPAPPPSVLPTAPTQRSPAQNNTIVNFSGSWLVVDTVEVGSGAGQAFSFEIVITQSGSILSGGNSGIHLNGNVTGQTAMLTYVQPFLGHSGTFTWTMGADGNAAGTFTSSVPNSGHSQLLRR